MANHVASSTAVQGNTQRVVGVEHVDVRGLTCLYTENCRFQNTRNTADLIIELSVTGERSWLVTFLKMIVNDVGDLAGFRDIFARPPQGDDDIRSASGWDRGVRLFGKVDRTLIDGEVVVPF